MDLFNIYDDSACQSSISRPNSMCRQIRQILERIREESAVLADSWDLLNQSTHLVAEFSVYNKLTAYFF